MVSFDGAVRRKPPMRTWPLYAGGLMLFIGTPLALGSYWGLLAFLATLPALLWLVDEERFLAKNLAGYTEYCAKVRSRLIPAIF
jgi:protein-S-isoprenylcysteine O-methyltransferase Ste14